MKRFVIEFVKLTPYSHADYFDTSDSTHCSYEQRAGLLTAERSLPKAKVEGGRFVTAEGAEIPVGATHFFDFEEMTGDIESAMRSIGFRTCDICHRWVSPQDIATEASIFDRREGKRYCRDCLMARDATPTIKVMPYHSSVFTVKNAEGENFTMDNVADGIGLELECVGKNGVNPVKNGRIKATDAFYADANPRKAPENRCWHVEDDGSVNVELISDCMTEKFFRGYDLSVVTDQLTYMRNDVKREAVGFHVHLSKGFLGSDAAEQIKNFNKVLRFINQYQSDFQAFSGRKETRGDMFYCSWMALDSIKAKVRQALSGSVPSWSPYEMSHGSAGCAVIASKGTVEFRFFHSTNDPDRVRAIVLFLIGLCKAMRNTNEKRIFSLSKAFRFMDDEVIAYLKRNGLFASTKANQQTGIED